MNAPPITPEIARQLGFTLDELALNRLGQLSDGQHNAIFWGVLAQLLLGVVLIGAGLVAFVMGWRHNLFWTFKWVPMAGVPLVSFLLFHTVRSDWSAYWKPTVSVTEGPIRFVRVRASMAIAIGTHTFGVSGKPQLLREGARYRVYHTSGDRRTLSLEPAPECVEGCSQTRESTIEHR
jgi:hypothetical protein